MACPRRPSWNSWVCLEDEIVALLENHVILGNSAAALSAVAALRGSGDRRPVVLVSAENHLAYSPVLTTYYIGGLIPRRRLFLVDREFYLKHQVTPMLGRRAVTVDPERKEVRLDGRTRLKYHDLLIATGASARPLKNVDPEALEFVSTLRTIEDAQRIRALAEKARDVVVVGAGLVSLQSVRAVLRPEIKVTAVVGSDQVLSQQLDRESAFLIQSRLQAAGVEILFGRSIERVERRGAGVEVRTGYGERLRAGLVVVGKGVQPNTGLVEGTAVKKDWGILVDEAMRTSVPGVYAAGDVAQGINQVSGESEVIATWFNASAQGEVAGRNMAGRPARRSGQMRENVTTLTGLVITAIGQSRPRPGRLEEIKAVDFRRGVVRKFFFDGPILMGALLIGRHPDAGVIRQCIAQRVDLSLWKAGMASTPLDYGQLLQAQVYGPAGASNQINYYKGA